MNSVMDDNKVLTLINGERISMPEQVRTEPTKLDRETSYKLITFFV